MRRDQWRTGIVSYWCKEVWNYCYLTVLTVLTVTHLYWHSLYAETHRKCFISHLILTSHSTDEETDKLCHTDGDSKWPAAPGHTL
jgi:hypothetical protein